MLPQLSHIGAGGSLNKNCCAARLLGNNKPVRSRAFRLINTAYLGGNRKQDGRAPLPPFPRDETFALRDEENHRHVAGAGSSTLNSQVLSSHRVARPVGQAVEWLVIHRTDTSPGRRL